MRRRSTAGDAGPPAGTARLAALRLLGRRDFSAAELVTRLVDRGFAADEVRATVAQLTTDGAVDDRRTAFAHVRTAARIKGRGRDRIRRELEARGIAAADIHDALSQVTTDDDLEAIQRLLARKRVPRPVPRELRRRLFQQLLRRGFPPPLVARALEFDPTDE